MSIGSMLEKMAPTSRPEPGPLLKVKEALAVLNDIDFGTPEYAEATQAALDVANAQRSRVVHGSRDSMVLAQVILGLARFLTIDWTQPGIEVSEDDERVLLASAFSYNPAQARAPKGTSIGGQWIDTPSGMLRMLNTVRSTPVMDLTPEGRAAIEPLTREVSTLIENYYTFGTEDARSIFEGSDEVALSRTYGNEEFSVEVDVVARGTTLVVEGMVTDRWGNEAGWFNRRIYKNGETGEMVVTHEHLELYEPYRHKGFGTDFSRQSEEMYADLGITRIDVTAGLSDGGLAWARAGYVLDEDNPYIDFDHQVTGEFQNLLEVYRGTEDYDTIDFLEGLALARRSNFSQEPTNGFVNLAETGYTIDDILAFKDADGLPIGEELLRGSTWYGHKYIEPSQYARTPAEAPEMAIAASGAGSTWAESKERADLLWEFCFTTGAEYTDDDWPAEQATAWRAIDADGRARWDSVLTASGSYNPNQARAPRGTPRGGQWIETPTGLLRLVQKMGPTGAGRSEPGTDVPGISLNRKAPLDEPFAQAWEDLDEASRVELAMNTKNYLQAAAEEPVKVQMWDNAIEGLANDGRMHTMRERIEAGEYYNGAIYIGAREEYEEGIAGVPTNLAHDQRPVYGWVEQSGSMWGEGVSNYGQNTVTLTEEAKKRTTLTIGDSLNYQSRPLWVDEINSETLGTDELLAASHWAIERNYTKDMEIKAINPELWDGGWDVNGDSYIEAQVYGGITLRDIASITIQSRYNFDEGTLQVFEDAGIEIITGDGS